MSHKACFICGSTENTNRMMGKPLCTKKPSCHKAAIRAITQTCADCKQVIQDGSLTLWSDGQICTSCSTRRPAWKSTEYKNIVDDLMQDQTTRLGQEALGDILDTEQEHK